jgi:hypothetical protein
MQKNKSIKRKNQKQNKYIFFLLKGRLNIDDGLFGIGKVYISQSLMIVSVHFYHWK